MAGTSSPTVWRRWLANELRRLRTQAGLSQSDVARVLGCKVPKVSLMESAERNVQDTDLDKLLRLFEVPEDKQALYHEAIRSSRKKAWWEAYSEHTIPDWLELFVGLEQGAERLRTYQTAIFHGLLHTPEYAAAILRTSTTAALNEEKVTRLVELRTRRQEAIWRETDPLQVQAIVDEAVLQHVSGSRKVMQAQLEHVIDVVQTYDHVTLQIVPFDRGAAPEATYGPFTILDFPSPGDPGVVYIEHRAGSLLLESLPDVDMHALTFERLLSLALSPEDSLKLLQERAEKYSTE